MSPLSVSEYVIGNSILFIAGVICSYFGYVFFHLVNGKLDQWKSYELLYTVLSVVETRNIKTLEIFETKNNPVSEFNHQIGHPFFDRELIFRSIDHAMKLNSDLYSKYVEIIGLGDSISSSLLIFENRKDQNHGLPWYTTEEMNNCIQRITNLNNIIFGIKLGLLTNLPWFRKV